MHHILSSDCVSPMLHIHHSQQSCPDVVCLIAIALHSNPSSLGTPPIHALCAPILQHVVRSLDGTSSIPSAACAPHHSQSIMWLNSLFASSKRLSMLQCVVLSLIVFIVT
eukprot:225779_1